MLEGATIRSNAGIFPRLGGRRWRESVRAPVRRVRGRLLTGPDVPGDQRQRTGRHRDADDRHRLEQLSAHADAGDGFLAEVADHGDVDQADQ